ncbi:MAG: phosphate ABC transporter substrate-binding protein [Oscillospiraceae bacterium]|jgi:phosphate transport system substrate-binding protein|nr:phosphate ABC transporter substrate-binding protein [Oscillospiraceae bacterium]
MACKRRLRFIRAATAAAFALCLPSCAKAEKSVVVAGSTSVQPYVEILAEEFSRLYPEGAIDIQGGGSSAGITAVESGAAGIGMSSRELSEKESGLQSIVIAKDALALIVHPNNPVNNLTGAQVRDIYTRKITDWSEVGGAKGKIHVISREEGSGTRAAFEELVMNGEAVTARAIIQNSNGAVRQLVSDDPGAVGFVSLGLAENQTGLKPVKALSLDGVPPTRESVLNGEYTLYRPFLLVTDGELTGTAALFVEFALSEAGQRILTEEGLISYYSGVRG